LEEEEEAARGRATRVRKGRTPLNRGRRDSCLLLNISVGMERDRITGRRMAILVPLPLNLTLTLTNSGFIDALGSRHPMVTFTSFCRNISFSF
jgi:hypothetical protein